MTRAEQISALQKDWADNPRWKNIRRNYSAEDVVRLRGSVQPELTYARLGAEKLFGLIHGGARKGYVNCLGALAGGQAVQQAKAGIEAIYLSGWQVAADANTSESMYPDQSLYAYDSVPAVVRRINNAFARADQIQWQRGVEPGSEEYIDYFLPVVADGEAGFGGVLNAYELTRNMIHAGAAGVHFEDQLAAVKKCGHMGGKVLIPTEEAVQKLVSARLACDVAGVPTLILARTDAEAANLLTSDFDDRDRPFLTGERTNEGFYRVKNGLEQSISRGVAYAPYADLVWCETSRPNIEEAAKFAEAIKSRYPDKLLAYNCSPSFNWKGNLSDSEIAKFQRELGAMGYKFQFVTLAGFHALNLGMFDLALSYKKEGMLAYSNFQQEEFAHGKEDGYMAITHQKFVGTGYFDRVINSITEGASSVAALEGSTEKDQF